MNTPKNRTKRSGKPLVLPLGLPKKQGLGAFTKLPKVSFPKTDFEEACIETSNSQKIYSFPNGYGASVVKHGFSYGIELAVLKFTKSGSWGLTYETPVTDNVLGHLNRSTLNEALGKIKALPSSQEVTA